MSYFSQWQEILEDSGENQENSELIQQYYELETAAYDKILADGQAKITGTASDIARDLGFGDQMVIFTGFLDGINSSLEKPLDMAAIKDSTDLDLAIDFSKLYWQMHEAKADWLYSLESWDQVMTDDQRKQLTREYKESKIIRREKVGRNDPCPCKSGKKFKNCCGKVK